MSSFDLNSTEVLAKMRDCTSLNYQKSLTYCIKVIISRSSTKKPSCHFVDAMFKTLKVFDLSLLFYVYCS